MFEGDFADTCAENFRSCRWGAEQEYHACADTGARTPIGMSGNLLQFSASFLSTSFPHTSGASYPFDCVPFLGASLSGLFPSISSSFSLHGVFAPQCVEFLKKHLLAYIFCW